MSTRDASTTTTTTSETSTSGRAIDVLVLCGLPPGATTLRASARFATGGQEQLQQQPQQSNSAVSRQLTSLSSFSASYNAVRERKTYAPGVLDEYPATRAASVTNATTTGGSLGEAVEPENEGAKRYPEQLATLALPHGVDAYAASEEPPEEAKLAQVYPVILTDASGAKVYVACVSFLAAVPERSRNPAGEDRTLSGGLARACVCLVSSVPCLDAWMEAALHVANGYYVNPHVNLPNLSSFASDVVERLRWHADRSVLFPVSTALVPVPPASYWKHDTCDAFVDAKEALFRSVSVRMIIKSVCAIACERRLLVRSKQVSLLVKCCEALRGLMYPLVWNHVYIPCVSISMVDYLGAPMPYIMGATRDVEVDDNALSGVVILDLDEGRLHDGGDKIVLPSDQLVSQIVERVGRLIKPGVIDMDDHVAQLSAAWTPEISSDVSKVFMDFWYELLQLNKLHQFVVTDANGGSHLRLHDYNNKLGHRRTILTDSILDTNAFVQLVSDVTILKNRSTRQMAKNARVRAKFRSVQLTESSTVDPPAFVKNDVRALQKLKLRMNSLDFDAQNEDESTEELDNAASSTDASVKAESAQTAQPDPLGQLDISKIKPIQSRTPLVSRIKKTFKRAIGSDMMSSAAAESNAENGATEPVQFDWYYNTMTKTDARKLSEIVRERKERYSELYDEDENSDEEAAEAQMQEDEAERITILLPIINAQDDHIADVLSEHAAETNYLALIDAIDQYLTDGGRRVRFVHFAVRAAATHADATGDSKSLARLLNVTRRFQQIGARHRWLANAARWDDVQLWVSLLEINDKHCWFSGTDADSKVQDIAHCLATVGLSSSQSSVILSQLSKHPMFSDVKTPASESQLTLISRSVYSSVSFESWRETLRDSTVEQLGISDVRVVQNVQHACPGISSSEQIWRGAPVTAMCVQSGVMTSLVTLGSGRGSLAFWAPDTRALSLDDHPSETSPISGLTFVPRSNKVFGGRYNGIVETWDASKCVRESVIADAHQGAKVSFVSPVVNQVISSAPLTASAGQDGTVKLWDARKGGSAVSIIKGHKGGVTAFATRDARGGAVGSILTGDAVGVVRAWDPRHANAGPVAMAYAHTGRVTCLAPLQMSDSTASAGADGVVRVLRLDGESGGDIRLSGHMGDITSLAVIKQETRGREPVGVIASGSSIGELHLWSGGDLVNDVRQPWRCVNQSRAHTGAVTVLSTDINRVRRTTSKSDTKWLLSASNDRSLAGWNLSNATDDGAFTNKWSPTLMYAPSHQDATESVCSCVEVAKRRLFSGDRFGSVHCATLPSWEN